MKYELEQTVFYLHNDSVCSAPIISRISVENYNDNITEMLLVINEGTLFKSKSKTSCRRSGNYYRTPDAIMHEKQLFASRAELFECLHHNG